MRKFLVFVAIAALMFTACGPAARVKSDSEGSLVGARAAGAEIYNELISETLGKLLAQQKENYPRSDKKLICFVDIENKGAEELAENKDAIYEQIDTMLVESGLYNSVSRRYVDSALRKTGLRPEDIFLSEGRNKFLTVLRAEGAAPDYLLWGTLTTMSTKGSEVKEREYLLTMEMVNAASGLTEAKKSSKSRKEYKK